MGRDSYRPVRAGLREIAMSEGMSKAAVAVGRELAGNAAAVGKSTYAATATTVTAGWANERRAGAVVSEVVPDGRDWRDAILLRTADAMKKRGRR